MTRRINRVSRDPECAPRMTCAPPVPSPPMSPRPPCPCAVLTPRVPCTRRLFQLAEDLQGFRVGWSQEMEDAIMNVYDEYPDPWRVQVAGMG